MTAPLRVLHVVPSYMPAIRYGGPIYSVHGLASATAALGHAVDVFTTNADGPGRLAVPTDRFVELDGVQVRYFPLGWPARLFRAPSMVAAARERLSSYDIVHIHALFLWPTARMAGLCRQMGVPYVVSPRGMLVRELFSRRSGLIKAAWMRLFDRRTLERASAIHWTAARERDDAAAFGYALPADLTIPNGVNLAESDAAPARPPAEMAAFADGGFLLSLGRINWKKNLPELVRAVARLDNVRLVIAGNDEDGDVAALRAAMAATGASDRIMLIDRAVVGAEKRWLYDHCDAFILPSISENFGNVAVEAMAAGAPVIVTEGCGVAEHVRSAGAGEVTSPDAEALSAAITRLMGDSSQRAMAGARGRTYVRDHLSWTAVARRMVDGYRSVLSARHA